MAHDGYYVFHAFHMNNAMSFNQSLIPNSTNNCLYLAVYGMGLKAQPLQSLLYLFNMFLVSSCFHYYNHCFPSFLSTKSKLSKIKKPLILHIIYHRTRG